MIIAIDIRVLGTGRTSGVEEYTEHLLEHMLLLDASIRFKLFYAGRTALVEQAWMALPNVSVYKTGRSNRLLSVMTRLAGRPHLDALIGGADAFFFPHFLAGATSPVCRRILTIHDLSFERFPEFFSFGRRLWHQIQMSPRTQVALADRVIAVSGSTLRDVTQLYGTSPDKVVAIHSGIDPSLKRLSDSDISDFRQRQSLPEHFILALGTLEPRKNIGTLIRAFEMLPASLEGTELVIAGPRGWLYNDLYGLAERSKAGKRIRFVENISSSERKAWLSAASVLAYPSFFEGFGFPPLEAMACGTPAIIGANSSMLEVCGSAALPIDPYSTTALRDALAALLSDGRLSRYYVERGSDRANDFSWHSCAERTLAELVHVVNEAK